VELQPGERVLYDGHPSWRGLLSFYLKGLVVVVVIGLIGALINGTSLAIPAVIVAFAIVVIVGYVVRLATTYVISDHRLYIRRGLIARRVQQTRLERVQNVNTNQSVLDRILRVGSVDFDTAGTDDADFTFRGITNPHDIALLIDRIQGEKEAAGRRDAAGL
jgi:uncharacterized membrane protein YdbT with pleckstrin-like domain